MLGRLVIPAHDKRLIPEGRLSGPMPWVIAIMIFLTVLAAAAGLALGEGARGLTNQLESQVTVQVVEADAVDRRAQSAAVVNALQRFPAVAAVKPVDEADMAALMAPWLGSEGIGEDIPLPALIDVELRQPASDALLAEMRETIRTVAPDARVEASGAYVAPVTRLVRTIQWIAAALVLLLVLSTAAAVVITARASLNTHRETIHVVHLLGGTDAQITRLFQRRIALDALMGGIAGLSAGVAIIVIIGTQLSALEPGLLSAAGLSALSWIIIALVPVGGTIIAFVTARLTVMGALKAIL
jgi:cell division transport system permease protein